MGAGKTGPNKRVPWLYDSDKPEMVTFVHLDFTKGMLSALMLFTE